MVDGYTGSYLKEEIWISPTEGGIIERDGFIGVNGGIERFGGGKPEGWGGHK